MFVGIPYKAQETLRENADERNSHSVCQNNRKTLPSLDLFMYISITHLDLALPLLT